MKPIFKMSLLQLADALDTATYLTQGELEQFSARLRELHDLTRWISVSERLPTQEDADTNDSVFVRAMTRSGNQVTDVWLWDTVTPIPIGSMTPTHWRRIDTPPSVLYRLTKDTQ